jgi:hypothetical protein
LVLVLVVVDERECIFLEISSCGTAPWLDDGRYDRDAARNAAPLGTGAPFNRPHDLGFELALI